MGADVQQLLRERRYDEALEAMLDLYEHKVFRMAVAMLRDAGRAEDVTQDIFLKMWRAFPAYDGRASVSTWLYAIARNTCLSAVRAESYRKTSALDDVPEPSAASSSAAVDWSTLLARLPDAQRHVITLFYFEERSITEVAAMMGLDAHLAGCRSCAAYMRTQRDLDRQLSVHLHRQRCGRHSVRPCGVAFVRARALVGPAS